MYIPPRSFLMRTVLLCMMSMHVQAQYTGTASVTHGLATTTVSNLYSCTGGRPTALGEITASDATVWTVPPAVNFQSATFPFASDLHNVCIGATYATDAAALAALNGSDIVTIDADGDVITGFIFADNYFEMYVNGVAVGKDKVPFTQFNSSIVRFRVRRPFTIAMLLVDWEEHLGLGCENNAGMAYHAGDGGMVAVFKDQHGSVIATTDATWKAQTFYTAPIKDLTCPQEVGTRRLSSACNSAGVQDGSMFYALHWKRPDNWTAASFDDSAWPMATTYTNAEIGVDNKPAYTNFTNVFDDPQHDAQFIWSTNVVLDNEVIVRTTVAAPTSVDDVGDLQSTDDVVTIEVVDILGAQIRVLSSPDALRELDLLPHGLYGLVIRRTHGNSTTRVIAR